MSGAVIVPLADHTRMIEGLGRAYFVDSVFIVAWIGAWTGLGLLLERTSKVMPAAATTLGVWGAVLDFAENQISWSLIAAAMEGTLHPQWLIAHGIVRHLSYLLPLSGAFVASLALVGLHSVASSVAALLGTLGVVIAMLGLYVPAFSLAPNVWFGAWFAGLAWVLWAHSWTETPSR